MTSRDPAGAGELEGLAEIPDPAAALADRPGPEPVVPAERSPSRRERRLRIAAGAGLAIAWLALVASEAGLHLGSPTTVRQLALWAVAGAIALALTVRWSRRRPAGVSTLRAVVAGVFTAFVAGALMSPSTGSETPLAWASTQPCASLALLFAAGPLVAAGVLARRAFVSAPAWRGAALGAVCGLAGSLGVHAHCPLSSAGHVIVAHGLSIALGAGLGAAFGATRGRA